jgi:hypothetical protein
MIVFLLIVQQKIRGEIKMVQRQKTMATKLPRVAKITPESTDSQADARSVQRFYSHVIMD